jgi:DNA-binding beta-propeller fold protein YncE
VSDPERHNIQKFDSSGTFLLKWGTQGNGELEFREPVSVVVRPDGKIYVADYQNSRIQVFRAVEN